MNSSFELQGENLVITDSDNNTVSLSLSAIASSDVFVENLTNNQEFMQRISLAADIPSLVKQNESLTTLENVVSQTVDEDGQQMNVYTLTYKDEQGVSHPIDISVLVKGSETLTALSYDPKLHILSYKDEQGESSEFLLTDLVGDAETLTELKFNANTKMLTYKDEANNLHKLNLKSINDHPWKDSNTNETASSLTSDIYTNGWVGIGVTEPSGAVNEKLRVNGSISAVNSYYADYVFENYFDGFSDLKYDYDFKSLDAVEEYIMKNRHLPGITPIGELSKSEEGYSINISELSIQLLEKTEELYLHIIEQKNQLKQKENRIKELEQTNIDVERKIERLEKMLLELSLTKNN
ncbi:hypothetical protein HX039_15730 [Myroides marinus]|uniref:hypothetical protein n=1 Tax=Myroides marinus TaxID=703342 RepID=UPI0025791A2B|nr:hypothetical protein [Myroides marinus]MDM1405537.1 hypothetical protein [Myroides marinus]